MKSYKCNYCEHHTGPKLALSPNCEACIHGNNFTLKTEMHPKMASDWDKHVRFDKFLDIMDQESDAKLLIWQREFAHVSLETRKPLLMARQSGYSTQRAYAQLLAAMFTANIEQYDTGDE